MRNKYVLTKFTLHRDTYKFANLVKKSKITAVPTALLLLEARLLFGGGHYCGSIKLQIYQGQH